MGDRSQNRIRRRRLEQRGQFSGAYGAGTRNGVQGYRERWEWCVRRRLAEARCILHHLNHACRQSACKAPDVEILAPRSTMDDHGLVLMGVDSAYQH